MMNPVKERGGLATYDSLGMDTRRRPPYGELPTYLKKLFAWA